jgi:hypothetical protein
MRYLLVLVPAQHLAAANAFAASLGAGGANTFTPERQLTDGRLVACIPASVLSAEQLAAAQAALATYNAVMIPTDAPLVTLAEAGLQILRLPNPDRPGATATMEGDAELLPS